MSTFNMHINMGPEEAVDALNGYFEKVVTRFVGNMEPEIKLPLLVWADTHEGVYKQRNLDNTAWVVLGPISGSWGVPVGTIITLAGLPAYLPGWVHLTGTTLVRADYPLLWEFALNSNNIVTDEVWYDEKRYGSYSYGDGETTFRIPMVFDFDRGWNPASGVPMGQWVEDTFQGHYHKIIEPISVYESQPADGGSDFWEETNEDITLQDHGFKTGQAVTDGINGEPRIGPETAPKHVLLPKYIYTGEVW